MTDQPVTNIVDLAKQFRKALEQRDNKALSQIIKAYGDMYARLQDKINLLTLQIANMETITAASVRKLDSYKSLIVEIEKELTKFQGYAGTVMQQSASDAITLGVRDARLLTLAGNPAVAAGWKTLNPKAIENLVGYFSEGSPLMKRLDLLAGTNALKVANTIIDNVALGNNPKKIAYLIRDSLGGGLTDALRMTRTVQLYSYREANRASYVANSDIVTGWYWMSALDPNSCMSCISLHGSFHTNDETLDDHHNGFCTMIPATKGSTNPFGENAGQKWFENLSEAEQRKYMGDGKFEAWKDNKFSFDQLSTTKTNDVFGDMRTETSLKDLLESDSNNVSDTVSEYSLEPRLSDFDNKYSTNNFETGAAYDTNGNEIFIKNGNSKNISFTQEEVDKMNGTIFTHNHPGSMPFSSEDIRFAYLANLKEMNIVSELYNYKLTPSENGWNSASINRIDKMFFSSARDAATNGLLSDNNMENYNQIIQMVSDKLGINYERIQK